MNRLYKFWNLLQIVLLALIYVAIILGFMGILTFIVHKFWFLILAIIVISIVFYTLDNKAKR